MTNAIPIERKAPVLPPITLRIMKIIPPIEKNIAAVLYDFEFFVGLLLIVKVPITY